MYFYMRDLRVYMVVFMCICIHNCSVALCNVMQTCVCICDTCQYVCVCVCMYIHVFKCMRACMHACINACIHAYMPVRMHAFNEGESSPKVVIHHM